TTDKDGKFQLQIPSDWLEDEIYLVIRRGEQLNTGYDFSRAVFRAIVPIDRTLSFTILDDLVWSYQRKNEVSLAEARSAVEEWFGFSSGQLRDLNNPEMQSVALQLSLWQHALSEFAD